MANKEKRKAARQEKAAAKQPFMSDRQKKVLLGVLVVLFISVPVIDILRCKAACMKRVKTPYPEIACRYECPWPWQKTE
ncbi:MAG: hypothetical protein HQL17_02125 [Candidatus Omnitrophica bacterium]|nr:hypothetical protein [Candidatus Omnitrophota bacterium]